MLTTPPGRSEVASTSARVIAIRGEAQTTTQVLPVTMTGAITEMSPSRGSAGAMMATTPVGSGDDRLKYGPATGLAVPRTAEILSDQPAYQTRRSMAASTDSMADLREVPSSSESWAANSARRASSISATRYRTWPRLYAVAPDQPGKALRAAETASRASLREAREALARNSPLSEVTV